MVRTTLASLLFPSLEPHLREWLAGQPKPPAPAPVDTGPLLARITALEEDKAKLEKKLSMAMGAMQAASAQIVQLRQEAEQAANLAQQAMQKATSALATAESATEGVVSLERDRPAPPEGGRPAARKPRKPPDKA